MGDDAGVSALLARVDELEGRLRALESVEAVRRVMHAYGYYLDKRLNAEIVELFSDDCVVEVDARGVYRGKKSVLNLYRNVFGYSKGDGLQHGQLHNHMILQGVVTVEPSGEVARARFRAFQQCGVLGEEGHWGDGVYENTFARVNGVWKIQHLHYFATFYSPYEKGWGRAALPNGVPSTEYPPDEPPSMTYHIFPEPFVPPFHYENPGRT